MDSIKGGTTRFKRSVWWRIFLVDTADDGASRFKGNERQYIRGDHRSITKP